MKGNGRRVATGGAIGVRFALGAAALLGLLIAQVAGTGGASAGPQATASASLSKQVKQLKKRVRALEAKPTPTSLPPSGPAGGDLTGSFPNPQLGTGVVGSSEVADNSLRREDAFAASGSFSLDLGLQNAQTCGLANAGDLPGVAAGDEILVFPDPASSEFTGSGTLIASMKQNPGNANLRVCNVGSSGVNPPSVTFEYVVLK